MENWLPNNRTPLKNQNFLTLPQKKFYQNLDLPPFWMRFMPWTRCSRDIWRFPEISLNLPFMKLKVLCSPSRHTSFQRRYHVVRIYSKLTIKTPEQRQWRPSGVFIVNFEHIRTSCIYWVGRIYKTRSQTLLLIIT